MSYRLKRSFVKANEGGSNLISRATLIGLTTCGSVLFPLWRDTATARPGVRCCGRRGARQATAPFRVPPA